MRDVVRRLGLDVPVIQAPIGSASTPELVAAVGNAGGLGVLALTWTPLADVAACLDRVRALTDRPFGVNLVLEFDIAERLELCLAAGVPVISTFWGDPAPVAKRLRGAGVVHVHTVGSVDEARRAARAGVDVIVAQGWEAGGHVRGTVAALPLIPAVVDAVTPVPVIAAGGIADGRGLAAVLALGAVAGWLGTRFLTATEAATHAAYRSSVIYAAGEDPVHTLCFADGWPDAPHRAIRNTTVAAWEAAGRPSAPHRPGEGDVVATEADGTEHYRYGDLMPLPGMTGDLRAMALYAGQSAGLVHDEAPAAEIVESLWSGARAALRSASAR